MHIILTFLIDFNFFAYGSYNTFVTYDNFSELTTKISSTYIFFFNLYTKSPKIPVPISQNTYLISARLLGCHCMLPLHDVAFDDVERP